MLGVAPFAADGARGLWQADAAGLAARAVLWAFAVRLDGRSLRLLALAWPLAGLAHLVLGGGLGSVLPILVLGVGVGCAAGGLALLGRAVGAPRGAAALLACAVLTVAMLGLFWADPVGDRLPPSKRFAFKQAVVHLDAATAAAYDGAAFDRFHDERVYADVKLASGAVRPPEGVPTGLAWLVVGLLSGAAAAGLRRGAPSTAPEVTA